MQISIIVDELKKHPTRKYYTRPLSWIKGITVHHSVGISNPWNVATYHVDTRGWPGIGYHYYIMEDGTIYKTNWHTTISYHVGDPNWEAIGICMNGNFTTKHPTQQQLDACQYLIYLLRNMEELEITRTFGHGQYPGGTATACPGATWHEWFGYIISDPEPVLPPPDEEEDMKFVELYPYIELLGEAQGKVFDAPTDGNSTLVEMPFIPADAKEVLVRVVSIGTPKGFISVGYREAGAYASMLAAFSYADDVPGSSTSRIPLSEEGGLYLLTHAPRDGYVRGWIRVYGYYK